MSTTYDTIVIGMGAAGTAAATTLARAGRRVLALEAQDRIGGRVNTVPFGGGLVELGAEWIHGTESSSVYQLAVSNNITLRPQELSFKVFFSDGTSDHEEIINDLTAFALGVIEDKPEVPEALGEYITRRVNEYIKTKYPALQNNTDFIDGFLEFMDLIIDNYESSNSWNDVTTETSYQELAGHQHMSWHSRGYRTLFDIMLNKYNNGPGLPSLHIKLSTEVSRVTWSRDPATRVAVAAGGHVYTADTVILTVSVGVLKERHASLFSPPLPTKKVELIEKVPIGVVNKIVLLFDKAFWPVDADFFGFIWKGEEKRVVPASDWWTTKIFGASCPMGHRRALTVWTSGDGAKLIETLPEDVLKTKVMGVIRKFMGGNGTIPDPVDMLRSTWYSNPYTRGSYTYDNLATAHHPGARAALGAPLADSAGSPRVLFAGEATDTLHFSTVHGAVDSGRREAMRLLPASKI